MLLLIRLSILFGQIISFHEIDLKEINKSTKDPKMFFAKLSITLSSWRHKIETIGKNKKCIVNHHNGISAAIK